MSNLIKNSFHTIKNDGFSIFCTKTKKYIKRHVMHSKEEEKPVIEARKKVVDFMFIDGCGDKLPQCSRYRVHNQIEQLEAYNLTTSVILQEELEFDDVRYANNFIFYRCANSQTITNFIVKAKELNKKVFYDIDDLVFDTQYTDLIPYVRNLLPGEKINYDGYVNSMKEVLLQADAIITTTDKLKEELSHYCNNVIINRNCISEEVFALSELYRVPQKKDTITIGYFSGSSTHFSDFNMISHPLSYILEKYDQVQIMVVGYLNIPDLLIKYKDRIIVKDFVSYQELPKLINQIDINLAPLEDSIFNEAKSEIKWIEASLLKKPTIASNIGSFKQCINDKETGFLCSTENEWQDTLEDLIKDEYLRNEIGENAYYYCKNTYLSTYSGKSLAQFLRQSMTDAILFAFPGTSISGGLRVALEHALILRKKGYSITILNNDPCQPWIKFKNESFPIVNKGEQNLFAHYRKLISTFWNTCHDMWHYTQTDKKYYLVQNFEVDFYPLRSYQLMEEPERYTATQDRIRSCRTYSLSNMNYITISKWCQKWLKERFEKEAKYAPNGIDCNTFIHRKRDFNHKIKVLIEGDCDVDYKRVDESFKITNQLDPEKFEISYMSYNGKPKDWYRVDKFYHNIPYEKVHEIYEQCDILIKSSILESFSYPPLEMMATGGYVVLVQNDGNSEYIKNKFNCLTYEANNSQSAIDAINELLSNKDLQETLYKNGLQTAREHDWSSIEDKILKLYE